MTIYTVHAPGGDVTAVDEVVFVKEGFCWPALFFAPLWLVYHGQWLGLLAYAAASAGLSLAVAAVGGSEGIANLAWLILQIVVAMHANDWRRWRLEAAGRNQVGVISGQSLEVAEARWFCQQAEQTARHAPTALPPRTPRGGALTPFATPFDPV